MRLVNTLPWNSKIGLVTSPLLACAPLVNDGGQFEAFVFNCQR